MSLVDGLAQLTFLVQGTLGRRAATNDLSLIQTRLLGVLRDREPAMNELAQLLELDKSSVTGLVDRAERRGLVARVPSSADRRATTVRLTATGRGLVDGVAADFVRDIGDIVAPLDQDERATLTALLTKILAAHAERHGLDLFPATPASPLTSGVPQR